MADDKKNIPDAGKVDNPPEPGKVEPAKTTLTVQEQPAPAKAEAPVVEEGAAFLRFPTGQGGLSVIVSYRSGRRPTWKIPYPSRRNTPIKSAKSNSLSRPSTRTKASPCVTSC